MRTTDSARPPGARGPSARASLGVVICLGDTLPHLESPEDVRRLLGLVSSRLEPGGRFVVGYRDSTGAPLAGVDRFIPVGRDASRTMHCLLEPLDDRHLRVTDIVTELEDDGPRTHLSDYVKLRIARDELAEWAGAAGMTVDRERVARGMTYLVFRAGAPIQRKNPPGPVNSPISAEELNRQSWNAATRAHNRHK